MKESDMIYNSITELIGNTPILKANNIIKKFSLKANLYVKLESYNPTGSAKDRIAKNMIFEAIRQGRIKDNSVIIEPTLGNTGIGLAAICASMRYKCIIVMPDSMSVERQKLMRAYGADIVLTDGKLGMKGAIDKAKELERELPDAVIMHQFDNPDNPMAHYKTTGPEIWQQMGGDIDAFIAAIGTGGTLSGTAKYLKEKNPDVKVFGVEPFESPLITKGISGPHKIQGIGANFIPQTLDKNVYDKVFTVSGEDAIKTAKAFAKTEGLLVGISSGAALACAINICKADEFCGKNIVVILPDTGERYLSTPDFVD